MTKQYKNTTESKRVGSSSYSIINVARIFIIAFFSTVLLSACSGNSNDAELQDLKSDIYVSDGHLIAIQSDNVLAAGYDANSMTMTVEFRNGYTYEYYNVPAELWNSFIAAQPHPWSAVGYPQLVQGGFQYSRIN